MKKRYLTLAVAALMVVVLSACSNKSQEMKSASTDKSSMTEKSSSKSSSKAEQSATESSSASDKSSVTLITDEEMNAAKTVGDYKKVYAVMIDNFLKYMDEIGEKIPEQAKSVYLKDAEKIKQQMEQAKKDYDAGIAQLGDDATEVPAEFRQGLLETLKAGRNQAQQILETAQKMLN